MFIWSFLAVVSTLRGFDFVWFRLRSTTAPTRCLSEVEGSGVERSNPCWAAVAPPPGYFYRLRLSFLLITGKLAKPARVDYA
jgi:hypothetical protein